MKKTVRQKVRNRMPASLQKNAENHWLVAGELDFDSVMALWPQLRSAVSSGAQVQLSLEDVVSSNSAAMALLLEAKQLAKSSGGELHVSDVPTALMDLLRLSNADSLLN